MDEINCKFKNMKCSQNRKQNKKTYIANTRINKNKIIEKTKMERQESFQENSDSNESHSSKSFEHFNAIKCPQNQKQKKKSYIANRRVYDKIKL